MKNAYEVLHQKEAELAQIRKQVESLHIAATLLAENDEDDDFMDSMDSEDDERMFHKSKFQKSSKKPSSSADDAYSREPEFSSRSSPFLEALKRAM